MFCPFMRASTFNIHLVWSIITHETQRELNQHQHVLIERWINSHYTRFGMHREEYARKHSLTRTHAHRTEFMLI